MILTDLPSLGQHCNYSQMNRQTISIRFNRFLRDSVKLSRLWIMSIFLFVFLDLS